MYSKGYLYLGWLDSDSYISSYRLEFAPLKIIPKFTDT